MTRERVIGWTLVAVIAVANLYLGVKQAGGAEWWSFDPSQWPGCDGAVCSDADAEADAVVIDTVGIAGSTNDEHVGEHHAARTGPKNLEREQTEPAPTCDEANGQPLRVALAFCEDAA